jgi:AcrR family transcriptional regulator
MPDKRSDILDATLTLVSERGFHDAPTSLIASEAGVGAGTIYRYFDSKDELIDQLYLHLKQQLAEAVLDGFSVDMTLRAGFRLLWMNTVHYYMDHPRETGFLEQYANSPYLKPETAHAYMEYFQPAIDLVQRGIDEGVMRDMPQELWTSLTFDVAVCLAKKHRAGTLVLDDPTVATAEESCWQAVRR